MSDHISEPAAPADKDGVMAAQFCADQVRTHDFVRYASTVFVTPERRRSLIALYAFSIEMSRVRDLVSQPLPGEIRLQWWRDTLAAAGQRQDHEQGYAADNPVAREVLETMASCGLPIERLNALIDAHEFDLYDDPMPSLAALEDYCDATSGALYELAAGCLGHRSDVITHAAHHAGIAHGLVAAMMRLPLHAARRQMMLPADILNEHNVNTADVFAGKPTPELFAAFDHLATEGRSHLNSATMLLKQAPREVGPAFLTLPVLRAALDTLARPDHTPFTPKPPSRLSILWRMWRSSRAK